MPRPLRIELLLFLCCFFAFGYFNQGGGWNQNARFAEVRAIVEQGRFAIDDFLVYKKQEGTGDLVRLPVERAEYEWEGTRHRLCWVDMVWTKTPVGDHPVDDETELEQMPYECSSGDIGYVEATGHFHPNKPPGTTLLAVPGYFVVHQIERLLGINPDTWWYVNLNGWLASVFSVGLISALGCVCFFRIARDLGGGAERPALLATLAFAFGTTFFPFSTLLFDHDLTASLLIVAFYGLRVSVKGERFRWWPAVVAGLCAGLAVLTNYVAVLAVATLAGYALWAKSWPVAWRRVAGYSLGGLVPAVALFAYGWACYGSPFSPSNQFQNPLFRDSDALMGMFSLPTNAEQWGYVWYRAVLLLISPWRGIFFLAPVLLMSLYGLGIWMRERRWAEVCVCFLGFLAFYVVNSFFNGYHAGYSAGPRYLIPGLPFLALPLVTAFHRQLWITSTLAVVAIAINGLLTATDAQNPAGVGGHARVKGHPDTTYNLVTEYAWPLFWNGQATPLLEQLLAVEMEENRVGIASESHGLAGRESSEQQLERSLREAIERGDDEPFFLASIRGPVSVNPLGVFEGLLAYNFYPAGSPQCRWASFNVGEFLWPGSRWSLLPLALVSGGLAAWALRLSGRRGCGASRSAPPLENASATPPAAAPAPVLPPA